MQASSTDPGSDSGKPPLAPESSVNVPLLISAPPVKKPIVATRANAKQTAILKRAFAASNTIRSDEIASLCEQTSLPEKWIYAWYGRQRAKARRAGDLEAGTARSSDPVLSMNEIMDVKTEHCESLLPDMSSSVEVVPLPKRKPRGRPPRPRLKAEFNDSMSVTHDVQDNLPGSSERSRPALLPLFIPRRSSLAAQTDMNVATSLPSTPLLYMRMPASQSSGVQEASSSASVDDTTKLHAPLIPQRSVFVSPIEMDATIVSPSVPSTTGAAPVPYMCGPQSWNGPLTRIYSPSEPVQALTSSISRRRSQVQVNHEFHSQQGARDFQQNSGNTQIDFQLAQTPGQNEVQSQPQTNTEFSPEQSPPFHTRFRNQGPSDYGSKSPYPVLTSSVRSINPINATTGSSSSPFLSSASGLVVSLLTVDACDGLATPFLQNAPLSWRPSYGNGIKATERTYCPPANLQLNTIHPVTASRQDREVMEAQDNQNREPSSVSSLERFDASFAWSIMPPGSASLPNTRCPTPPPELLYPFESLELDTSIAIDLSGAPVKHIEDLLKPFFVGGCQTDEVAVVKTDGLVNALLDEELVHKDPFKAAMSLVFASQLGLQWDYSV